MSLVEAIAVLFGLMCVFLTIRQNNFCWPAGLVQVALYIYIFFQSHLYSDMILQVIYIPVSIYGWMKWQKRNPGGDQLNITVIKRVFPFWLIGCIFISFAFGSFMKSHTDAALPYPDSFITVSSLAAQWLMAKKKLESWLLWIIVDITAVMVYFTKGLYLTTGLYAVFLFLALAGYINWYRVFRNSILINKI